MVGERSLQRPLMILPSRVQQGQILLDQGGPLLCSLEVYLFLGDLVLYIVEFHQLGSETTRVRHPYSFLRNVFLRGDLRELVA